MEIKKITERKDGSADVVFTMTKVDEEIFKNFAKQKKKRYSKKFVSKWILEAIEKGLKKTW